MLQTLREHAQGWIAGIIAGLLALAFALWGVEYYLSSNSNGDVVAKVNRQPITRQQLDATYQRLRQQIVESQGALTLTNVKLQNQLKQQALEELIHREILSQSITKQGFRVNPQQVNAIIMQIPAFQENGQFSLSRYQQSLNAMLYTPQEFLLDLEKNLVIMQQRSGLVDSAFVTENEVDQALRLTHQKRDFSYLVIPRQNFLKQATVTDNEIQDYYNQHKEEFIAPEQISLEYVELSAKDLTDKINPTEVELKEYYGNNAAQFSTPKQWQVAQILIHTPENMGLIEKNNAQDRAKEALKKLQSGTPFAQIVSQYSDDKATAIQGGTLNWFNAQQQPNLAQQAAKLQPGQFSEVFQTPEGYRIIKLIAVKQPQAIAYENVHDQVLKAYKQQKLEQKFNELNDKLSNIAYTNPGSLQPVAEAVGTPIKTTPLFTQQGMKEGIAANPKVLSTAFSDDVLRQNNNSDPIQLSEGDLIVLRIGQHVAATQKPLAQVRPEIVAQLQAKKSAAAATAFADKVLVNLNKKVSVDSLLASQQLVWHQVQNVGAQNNSIDPAIIGNAFNSSVPTSSQPTLKRSFLKNGDVVVISVNKVVEGNANLDPQQKAAMADEMANTEGSFIYNLYMQEQFKKAKLKKMND